MPFPTLTKSEFTWEESQSVFDPTLRQDLSSGWMRSRLIVDEDETYYDISLKLTNISVTDLITLEVWEKTILIGTNPFTFTDFNSVAWTLYLMAPIKYRAIRGKNTLYSAEIQFFGRK